MDKQSGRLRRWIERLEVGREKMIEVAEERKARARARR